MTKELSEEFVKSVILDNNIEAEKAFNDSISTKVGQALEIKRREISQSIVSTKMVETKDEEFEEIEEEETAEGAVKGAVVGAALGGPVGAAIGGLIGHQRRKAGVDKFSKKALKAKKAGKKLSLSKATAAATRQKALKTAGISDEYEIGTDEKN